MRKKNADREPAWIGIYGLHRGIGTTHLTILLASYLSRWKRCPVKVWLPENEYSRLHFYVTGEAEVGTSFRTRRCTYVPRNKLWLPEPGQFRNSSEEVCYQLFDLSGEEEMAKRQIVHCQKKLILGAAGALGREDWMDFWKNKEVRNQLRLQGTQDWYFLTRDTRTGLRLHPDLAPEELQKRLWVRGYGTEKDLFHPSKEAVRLFSEMDI